MITISIADRYEAGQTEDDRRVMSTGFDICINWFDGHGSAMWRLVDDKAVPVAKVLAELDGVLESDTETAIPWHGRVNEFRSYCVRQIDRHKALNALKKAAERAKAAGIAQRDFTQAASVAFAEIG